MRLLRALCAGLLTGLLMGAATLTASPAAARVAVKIAVLTIDHDRPLPLSRLELPTGDEGAAGARLALADNSTTGRFLGHDYEGIEATARPEDAAAALDQLIADGFMYVVVLADADNLLALADHAAGRDVLLFNAEALDDRLRGEDCRANVLHAAPSRAMLADGLAQYLVWKKWTSWVLIHGSHPSDHTKAAAYRRAARKFGARIVAEREYEDTGGGRISDSAHVLVQRQMPVFTQGLPRHDVVVAADENGVFAAYLPYRMWDPRPVVGDAGLRARIWSSALDAYGATQVQRRFERLAGRAMTDVDYAAWTAGRAIGEAVTRTGSADLEAVRGYLLSDDLELGAFKGLALSFRPWNNQLRQGIILADERMVVTISPQDEFLHQRTRLDTLGYDAPETSCAWSAP